MVRFLMVLAAIVHLPGVAWPQAEAARFAGMVLDDAAVRQIVRGDWADVQVWSECTHLLAGAPSNRLGSQATTCLQLAFAPKPLPGQGDTVIWTQLHVTDRVCQASEAEACYRGYSIDRMTQSRLTGWADQDGYHVEIVTRRYLGLLVSSLAEQRPPPPTVSVARDGETAPIRGLRWGKPPGVLVTEQESRLHMTVSNGQSAATWVLEVRKGDQSELSTRSSGAVPALNSGTGCAHRAKEAVLLATQTDRTGFVQSRASAVLRGKGGAGLDAPAQGPAPEQSTILTGLAVYWLCQNASTSGSHTPLVARDVLTAFGAD